MAELGFHTTADDVLADVDMSDRRVLITGGASGLGFETARAMAARGAHIVIAARDMDKGSAAADAIIEAVPTAEVEVMELDLAELDSIRAFATIFLREYPSLDLLINNAGVMAPPKGTTKDGFETQFGTNHLGHFLLSSRLLPALKASAKAGREPRVVMLSSRGHHTAGVDLDDPNYETAPYDKWEAYGRSKSANALFAREFDRRYSDAGIRAYSVHPGGIMTQLSRHMDEADFERIRSAMALAAEKTGKPAGLKTVEQGAATTCYAATADLAGEGGKYLEDCGVAEPVGNDIEFGAGAKAWIRDDDVAERLWAQSEEFVGEAFGSA